VHFAHPKAPDFFVFPNKQAKYQGKQHESNRIFIGNQEGFTGRLRARPF